MVRLKAHGDFKKLDSFLERALNVVNLGALDKYGREGVKALRDATPVDSGKTADSWDYKIVRDEGRIRIVWTNSNVNDGCMIAILIQYGHGTAEGSYVEGRDYINPAMRPVFDGMAEAAWKEVIGR